MCGIAGILNLDRSRPADLAQLREMAATLRHRGPDEAGDFAADGAALACQRLSIVDIAHGGQPHFNETGDIVSVCNGEIYNHEDLRRELEARGHRLRTRCDVEVLVHLYETYGPQFASRLNGQFAFALYDRPQRRLVLGRDQAGIAPLFYAEVGGSLLFASEIKALLRHPDIERRVDLAGLDQILTLPGLVSPTTMFQGVRSLAPGSLLLCEGGSIEVRPYWDLAYPERCARVSPADIGSEIERLDQLLQASVRRRLQADVPVSLYLSGGLDSSLVAALACHAAPERQLHSFSITFPDARIDERASQRAMAGALGTIHHEIEFQAAEITKRLRQAVTAAEAPLKESYDTCSLALSSAVRESGHKVVLTGEGADELFAGYVGYRLDAAGASRAADGLEAMLEAELRSELWGDPDFYYEREYFAFRDIKAGIYSADVASALPRFDSTRRALLDRAKIVGRHPLHQRSYADFKLRLADHLLADHGDRVSYANSVEARYPFLDLDLIEHATGLPPELLVRGGVEKWLLRQVAARHLPAEIATREKFSFVAPGAAYLMAQRTPWIDDLMSPARIRRQNYFDADMVERLTRRQAESGERPNATFETDVLMLVLTFGIFLEAFGLDG